MKKITNTEYRQGKLSDLSALMEILLKDYEVVAPVKKEGKMLQFEIIHDPKEIDMENFPHAQLSFKQWLLPRDQVLLKYQLNKNKIIIDDSVEPNPKKRVIFGLHSCDFHAVEVLDRVFLEEDDPDLGLHGDSADAVVGAERDSVRLLRTLLDERWVELLPWP